MSSTDRQTFGSINLDYSFWEEFEYMELTINMRQKIDAEYASMLDRIRLGVPNHDDIEKLMDRKIPIKSNIINDACDFMQQKLMNEETILALCSTNDQVDSINVRMIKLNNIEAVVIKAEDSQRCRKQISIKTKKLSETAGLITELLIGVNSRVMLRRNIDTDNGLCNGAIGTVKQVGKTDKNEVYKIMVQFDHKPEVVFKIEKISADYMVRKNIYTTRTQFPLTLSWAMTIHKCQGLTLTSALIDIGNSVFEPGMAYVALSRVTTLNNVHLIDFEPSKLICNNEAVLE